MSILESYIIRGKKYLKEFLIIDCHILLNPSLDAKHGCSNKKLKKEH